ncbi:erythroblast NAD(P)(+)--arginine ADP-ribosyltransferase-like isoform X2 [Chamaea fasciata]
MAPLAHTLALLAMAVATAAIEVVPLDMAKNSFDDQYLKCSVTMTKKFRELQRSDFRENEQFKDDWTKATDKWKEWEKDPSPLTEDQAIALMAYTMQEIQLYNQFNKAVREAGRTAAEYQNEFHFKSLHFLLTRALQKLRRPKDCKNVIRGVKNYHFDVNKGDKVRFGQFTSTSLSEKEAQKFGEDTMFKVYTCHGVEIQEFSVKPWQKEVLVPPFETFKVTSVSKEGNTMHIELHSTGNSSNYECAWLKGDIMGTNIWFRKPITRKTWEDQGRPVSGGSLPRNSPNLGGLLLATVAMAVVTGIL